VSRAATCVAPVRVATRVSAPLVGALTDVTADGVTTAGEILGMLTVAKVVAVGRANTAVVFILIPGEGVVVVHPGATVCTHSVIPATDGLYV
jgi:hypothetical protein